jgi:hypothetical protein
MKTAGSWEDNGNCATTHGHGGGNAPPCGSRAKAALLVCALTALGVGCEDPAGEAPAEHRAEDAATADPSDASAADLVDAAAPAPDGAALGDGGRADGGSGPSGGRRGLHWTEAELGLWRDRIAAGGPYVTADDESPGSPGDWTRIEANAAELIEQFVVGEGPSCPSGSFLEAHTGLCVTGWGVHSGSGDESEVYRLGNHIRDTGFVYLLFGNAAHARAVRAALHVAVSRSFAPCGTDDTFGDTSCFFMPDYLLKLVFAYDYVRDAIPADERSDIESVFRATAVNFAEQVHHSLAMNFPNRLDGDYGARGRAAREADYREEHTHREPDGTRVNRIPALARWYNNRRAAQIHYAGQVGVLLDDDALVHAARTYFTEWLRFSGFPDGMQGEYERSDTVPKLMAGIWYGAINVASAIWFADALARRGDCSLYLYETRDGLFGTESEAGEPAKDLQLYALTHAQLVDGTLERYADVLGVAPRNRLDAFDERQDKQWLVEIWYAPGNQFWRSEYFTEAYTRRSASSPGYDAAREVGSAGPHGAPWGGWGFQLPGVLFMFGQTEGRVWPYPTDPLHGWSGGEPCPAP